MTKICKALSTAIAVATLSTAALFTPVTAANAGYYSPSNGFYGKPYYPPVYYQAPRCHWVKYKYRDPYGYGWLWGRRWVCG